MLAKAFKFKSWQVMEVVHLGWNKDTAITPLFQNPWLSEIRWASAYLIQKARVLQEPQGKPETDKHSQREGV